MKNILMLLPALVLTQATAFATDEVKQSDGVDFPENAVVHTIHDFVIPNSPGAKIVNIGEPGRPQLVPDLNVFHTCNNPQELGNCLQTARWFTGCPVVQKNPIVTSAPTTLSILLDLGHQAYFRASHPDNVRFSPVFVLEVRYHDDADNKDEVIRKVVNASVLEKSFMFPLEPNIAVWDTRGYKRFRVEDLDNGSHRIELPLASNIEVAFCDVAPGIFQVKELSMSFSER